MIYFHRWALLLVAASVEVPAEVVLLKNAGIYSENIGILQRSVAQWKFFFHFENKDFKEKLKILTTDLSTLTFYCIDISNSNKSDWLKSQNKCKIIIRL